MTTGVVIGKFYPPHLGHSYLIDEALKQCDQLTVIVCDHPDQKIPGSLRGQWLRELHPAATVIVTPDDLPDAPEPWATRTMLLMGGSPTFVFTSEDYGPEYARQMGSSHILVDRDRVHVPVSATEIRENPYALWQYLPEPVRAWFCLRVILIGVESTGKTTLSEALARELDTVWVPEYGREYTYKVLERADPTWVSEDFVEIAREQVRQENEAARHANRVLIGDTDAFATGVWHERYMETRSAETEALGDSVRADLYILTVADFPFVQDGIRDGEHIREWMHQRFLERLSERGVPVLEVSGSHEDRLAKAMNAIERLIESNPRMSR